MKQAELRRVETRRDEMNVGDLALAGLLVALGLVLHGIFPGIVAGMKPDFSLIMLFIAILVIPDKKVAAVTGLATAVITAMTTSFPGGHIANIVDKIITTAVVIAMAAFWPEVLPKRVLIPTVGVLGTLVSGVVFLRTAALLADLPAAFTQLFVSVVLPAAAINTAALLLLYPLAAKLYSMQTFRSMRTAK